MRFSSRNMSGYKVLHVACTCMCMHSINDIHYKYIIGFITQCCCREQYLCELALLIGCTGESKGIVGSETV